MSTAAVIAVVSGALPQASLGVFRSLPTALDGFIVAFAGSAVLQSAVLELIERYEGDLGWVRRAGGAARGGGVQRWISWWPAAGGPTATGGVPKA